MGDELNGWYLPLEISNILSETETTWTSSFCLCLHSSDARFFYSFGQPDGCWQVGLMASAANVREFGDGSLTDISLQLHNPYGL